ncbi:MAG: helix-turn-helix domain-containing protein [Candidatus Saccharimonadales bacterium]
MDEIHKWLDSYGLNDSEIAIYTCILQYPEIKVSDMQRHTGLVRTTIYYTLAQLKAAGLISENTQNNVKTYRCTEADALKRSIETDIVQQRQKLERLDSLKSVFQTMEAKKSEADSYIARYEGIEPVKQSIEKALRCDSKQWQIIASRDNFLYHMSKQYQQYYLKERKRRGITAKTLWEPTNDVLDPSMEDVFYRNPRRLPEEFRGAFNSLVIVYDDTTLIIDPYDQKTAHAIHNAASTDLLRLVFNAMWRNTKPPTKSE